MSLYNLPLGIRIPTSEEYPKENDVKSINDKRDLANITQGFVLSEVSGEKFSYYAEVNIDAEKIWDVFCSLTNKLIDEVAYGVIGFKEEEPVLSDFTKTERLVEIFSKFKFELTNDGFLEFGIASNDEKALNEIFISSFKYMRIWTTRKESLIQILNSFGIEQMENLQFIDEFPVVSEALSDSIVNGISHYSKVMEWVEEEFNKIQML